jgi:hypothetical protein
MNLRIEPKPQIDFTNCEIDNVSYGYTVYTEHVNNNKNLYTNVIPKELIDVYIAGPSSSAQDPTMMYCTYKCRRINSTKVGNEMYYFGKAFDGAYKGNYVIYKAYV